MQILFEDDQIMVINKPPGLVSTPSETHRGLTLADILNEQYGISLERGGLVHRLDKDTSGVILAAKSRQAFDSLQDQFRDRIIKKEYVALVHGLTEQSGVIEAEIGRNPIKRDKFTVLEGGRESATEYKLQQHLVMDSQTMDKLFGRIKDTSYGKFSLISCFPKTGRTHQIRVHLKYISRPIVSDDRYVGRKTLKMDQLWCPRIFLHAYKIEFKHPGSGEQMSYIAPVPNDLMKALENLQDG